MKTMKQEEYRLTTSDAWIIGTFSLLGLCAGFFMPKTSAMIFIACLMVGVRLGLVISSILAKNNSEKQ